VALLQAGTGASASLLAAWTGDGQAWTLSPAFTLSGSHPVSASSGADGAVAVVLSDGRGVILSGPGDAWRQRADRLAADRPARPLDQDADHQGPILYGSSSGS